MDDMVKRKKSTSTAAKMRYNNKVYDQLAFKLPKDMVRQFKEKCAREGIPQAQIIKSAIERFLGT